MQHVVRQDVVGQVEQNEEGEVEGILVEVAEPVERRFEEQDSGCSKRTNGQPEGTRFTTNTW